ncbi:MAG: AAA family ATPase [Cyanobacteria bacterium P01_E01_bin.42]
MKIKIKNLGILKQAEFSLGDLTIICGENNTGKTYAAYALFGFLSSWRKYFSIDLKEQDVKKLIEDGIVHLDLLEYFEDSQRLIDRGCQKYARQLYQIFASPSNRFENTEFKIEIDIKNDLLKKAYKSSISLSNKEFCSILKDENDSKLTFALLSEEKMQVPQQIIEKIIIDVLQDILFKIFFPNSFIASAERTGTAIFRKELNFARNRLLEELSQLDRSDDLNPIELLLKGYDDYALPIKRNVEFTRNLESISKNTSFIAEKYQDFLRDFSDIIGGEYNVNQNGELSYTPKGEILNLSMPESSSAVRSLLDIGFYLKHIARVGDLLIVDEPELNLHPENQRRIARLFVRLVNIGVKVFITTHSDYPIKELNTLIMLNHDRPYLKKIAETEGYQPEELLAADRVKLYVAEEVSGKLDDNEADTHYHTLTPANISPELGIEVTSFDRTIETMNRIQEAIIWGEE